MRKREFRLIKFGESTTVIESGLKPLFSNCGSNIRSPANILIVREEFSLCDNQYNNYSLILFFNYINLSGSARQSIYALIVIYDID